MSFVSLPKHFIVSLHMCALSLPFSPLPFSFSLSPDYFLS